MEAIENSIIIPIKDLITKSSLGVDITLAILGFVAIVFIFLISLLIILFSNMNSFRKKLIQAKDFLKKAEEITEDNVEDFNEHLKKMPESVERGWSCFLEQKLGYPSDYITKRDVLSDKKFDTKNTGGKIFYRIFSVIVIAIVIWLEVLIAGNDSLMSVGIEDFTSNFNLVGAILAAFFVPLIAFVIFNFVLNAIYNAQYKKLEKSFLLFQNIMDDKIVIYAEENDEFISENIDEINVAVEEIIANKLDEKEIIEIVTAPMIEDKQNIEMVEAEKEPEIQEVAVEDTFVEIEKQEEPEIIKEETYIAPVVIPEDIIEDYNNIGNIEKGKERIPLNALVETINAAINDKQTQKNDLEQLALIVDRELNKGYANGKEQAVFVECLQKLAEKYQSFENKK